MAEETPDHEEGFDEDFDAERAKRLIRNLRNDKAALRRERDEARSLLTAAEKERDEHKSAAETAKKDLAADRRSAILKEFEIDEDDAEEFLSGDLSLDELRRKAERLAGRRKKDEPKDDEPKDDEPQDGDGDQGDSDAGEPDDAPKLPTRPKPALKPGHGGEPEAAIDIDGIAAYARRH